MKQKLQEKDPKATQLQPPLQTRGEVIQKYNDNEKLLYEKKVNQNKDAS